MIAATSATVRNRTALSGLASAAIDSPLRRFPLRQAISSAPVTPVSSVIGTRKRATPEQECDLAACLSGDRQIYVPNADEPRAPLHSAYPPPSSRPQSPPP